MKRLTILLIIATVTLNLMAQRRLPQYEAYIAQYKQLAIENRDRYGIPAAITMAQGILESNAGLSELATDCNNHFGIKCGSSWYGKTMNKDDDARGECFRCYSSAQESYSDHSEFLKRQRYAFLFDYKITDYGAWAKGLSRAGYATDPGYPQKLISIIETYELYELDGGRNLALSGKPTNNQQDIARADKHKEQTKREEKPKFVSGKIKAYEVVENNGVRCIRLTEETTFAKLSKMTRVSVARLLYVNDLPKEIKLDGGQYIYLAPKKHQADRSLPVYVVKSGDSMHSIAQEFGIKLKALYRLNNLEYGTPVKVGQQLKLHK